MMNRIVLVLIITLAAVPGIRAQQLAELRGMYNAGQYEELVPRLTTLLEASASGDVYMLRADCLQKLGEVNMALQDYDRAKLHGYKGDDLLLHRGICEWSMGAFEQSKLDLAQYIEKHPEDAKGYYWMAALEYMNMDHKACLRYVDEAIWIDSTYAEAYYLRGANYMEQRKTNFALEDFESAFLFNTQLHRAKLNMAVILLDEGQYQNAIELLGELKNEDIDFIGEVLYYSGEAMFRLHDVEGACIEWKEGSEAGDEDATANYKRICMDKTGKPKFKNRVYGQF